MKNRSVNYSGELMNPSKRQVRLKYLNATTVDEVFWLVKEEGYTQIRRANENAQVVAYMKDGDQMGYLWDQGFFEGSDPQ